MAKYFFVIELSTKIMYTSSVRILTLDYGTLSFNRSSYLIMPSA